jgi:hypothetical protein
MPALWPTHAPPEHSRGFLVRALWMSARGGCRVYRWPPCRYECRPLLDLLDVEPGRISGALARLLALLATVAPYPLAARVAWLLLGVVISPMGIWRVAQRLGEAAARYQDGLSRYHADSRSVGAPTPAAPPTVVLSVDGCSFRMQVRSKRRRRKGGETLPPLPALQEGQFREVKTRLPANHAIWARNHRARAVFCCCPANG